MLSTEAHAHATLSKFPLCRFQRKIIQSITHYILTAEAQLLWEAAQQTDLLLLPSHTARGSSGPPLLCLLPQAVSMQVVVERADCKRAVPPDQADMRTWRNLAAAVRSDSTAALGIGSSPSIGGMRVVEGPSSCDCGRGSSRQRKGGGMRQR